jgi:hypothetical protein
MQQETKTKKLKFSWSLIRSTPQVSVSVSITVTATATVTVTTSQLDGCSVPSRPSRLPLAVGTIARISSKHAPRWLFLPLSRLACTTLMSALIRQSARFQRLCFVGMRVGVLVLAVDPEGHGRSIKVSRAALNLALENKDADHGWYWYWYWYWYCCSLGCAFAIKRA